MTGWDTGHCVKQAHDCDYAEDVLKPFTIDLSDDVLKTIKAMCVRFPQHEWQMMLTGKIEERVVRVTGYWIPKQEVFGSTVKNLDVVHADVIKEKNIVGTIHSHVNMGVFFSQTDEKDTNLSIIDHHVVVNNRGEYKACSKISLPCGMVKLLDSVVSFGGCDTSKVVVAGIENVKIPAPVVTTGGWNADYTQYHGYAGQNDKQYDDEKTTKPARKQGYWDRMIEEARRKSGKHQQKYGVPIIGETEEHEAYFDKEGNVVVTMTLDEYGEYEQFLAEYDAHNEGLPPPAPLERRLDVGL